MTRTPATFADKVGTTGHEDDRVVVPTLDDEGFPALAAAHVVEVVVREPSPFASELSVRVRLDDPAFPDDTESRVYEPDEVIVVSEKE